MQEGCAVDHPLEILSPLAGAALQHHTGANRAGNAEIPCDDPELQKASIEVRGHALTLALVGQYLRLTCKGDILRRDCIKLADAEKEYKNDDDRPYGHAFKAIEAYETWFSAGDAQARRQLAVLRLLGLFDRPATADCLAALRELPVIPCLTDPLAGIPDKDWNLALSRLTEINLLTVNSDDAVDCHPLIREYFATRLKEKHPHAYHAAHSRLFDHLCGKADYRPDTIADLQPLYHAVAHGCLAERHDEALGRVFRQRLRRGKENFSFRCGYAGSDLGALSCFFDEGWSLKDTRLSKFDQAYVLNETGSALRTLGRITEAPGPVLAALNLLKSIPDLSAAANVCNNLLNLYMLGGSIEKALETAEEGVAFADAANDVQHQVTTRVNYINVLESLARPDDSRKVFEEAVRIQPELITSPQYGLQSSRVCQMFFDAGDPDRAREIGHRILPLLDPRLQVREIAYYRLTLGLDRLRAGDIAGAEKYLPSAVAAMREARRQDGLPYCLMGRASLRNLTGPRTGSGSAQSDLDEAWEIARRGPMPLFMANIHLHRARLFGTKKAGEPQYPWESPQTDLAEARRLIFKHRYWRKLKELEDGENGL
jgi:tetratricopeptide (TPR) repeat protein